MLIRIVVVVLTLSGSILQTQTLPAGLRQAEEQLAKSGDAATWLYAAELKGTDIFGRWLDRTGVARQSYDLSGDLVARAVGEGASLIVGTAVAGASGRTIRFLHVWARREGQWRLVAFHDTAVAPDGVRRALDIAKPLPDARLRGSASGLEEEVRQAERERREIFAAHSAERYSQVVTPDYLSILINGVVQGRAERAAMVPSHFVYDLGDMAVTMLSESLAVVQVAQSSEDGPMRSTRVWVKRDGGWMVAAHAGSLVARVTNSPA